MTQKSQRSHAFYYPPQKTWHFISRSPAHLTKTLDTSPQNKWIPFSIRWIDWKLDWLNASVRERVRKRKKKALSLLAMFSSWAGRGARGLRRGGKCKQIVLQPCMIIRRMEQLRAIASTCVHIYSLSPYVEEGNGLLTKPLSRVVCREAAKHKPPHTPLHQRALPSPQCTSTHYCQLAQHLQS